jgi:hypothetical protein
MNILVCLSQVPDTTTKIVFSADNKSLNKTGVQYIINPYDELALTKALELNEATGGGTVTVIHVGGADAEPEPMKLCGSIPRPWIPDKSLLNLQLGLRGKPTIWFWPAGNPLITTADWLVVCYHNI